MWSSAPCRRPEYETECPPQQAQYEVVHWVHAWIMVEMQYFVVYVAVSDITTLRVLAEKVFPAVQPH